jgi:hypothetical protein
MLTLAVTAAEEVAGAAGPALQAAAQRHPERAGAAGAAAGSCHSHTAAQGEAGHKPSSQVHLRGKRKALCYSIR